MEKDLIFEHTTKARQAKPLPGWKAMAKNLVNTAVSVASAAARGEELIATQAQVDARLAVCQMCEAWRPEDQRCAECGCFTSWKSRLAAGNCPLGKWTV